MGSRTVLVLCEVIALIISVASGIVTCSFAIAVSIVAMSALLYASAKALRQTR